jgi:Protein of unknown function (DUF2911)
MNRSLRMLTVAAALGATAFAQNLTLPASSPRAGVSQTIGITKVSVDYGRPAVNKREVWGKLVPYGLNDLGFGTTREAPWRAGADVHTVVTFEHAVRRLGQLLLQRRAGRPPRADQAGGQPRPP